MAGFGDNNADMAVVLPTYGMSPAQADMFQAQMAAKQPKVKPYETPAIPVTRNKYNDNSVKQVYDKYFGQKMKEYQNWAISNKASEAELKNHILADTDFADRNASFDKLDAIYNNIPATAKQYQATYGTDTHIPFQNKGVENFHKDLFDVDANGNPVAPKALSSINIDNYNPFNGVESDDFLQNGFNNRNKAVDAHLSSLPSSDVEKDYEERDLKGNVTKRNLKAKVNAFMNINNVNGVPKGLIVPSSQVTIPSQDPSQAAQTLQVLPPELQHTLITDPKMRFDILQLAKINGVQAQLQKQYPNADTKVIQAKILHDYISGANSPTNQDGEITSNGLMSTMYKKNEAQKAPLTKNSFNINLGEGGKNFVPIPNVKSTVNMIKDPLGVDKEGKLSINNLMDADAVINGKIGLKGKEVGTFYSSINKNLPKETNDKIAESQNKFNSLLGIQYEAAPLIRANKNDEYFKLVAKKANEINKDNGIEQSFTPQDIRNGLLKYYKQSELQPITDKDGNYLDANNQLIKVDEVALNLNKGDIAPPNAKMVKRDIVSFYNPTSTAYANLHNSFVRQFQEGNSDEKATNANYGLTPGQHEITKHSSQYSGTSQQVPTKQDTPKPTFIFNGKPLQKKF